MASAKDKFGDFMATQKAKTAGEKFADVFGMVQNPSNNNNNNNKTKATKPVPPPTNREEVTATAGKKEESSSIIVPKSIFKTNEKESSAGRRRVTFATVLATIENDREIEERYQQVVEEKSNKANGRFTSNPILSHQSQTMSNRQNELAEINAMAAKARRLPSGSAQVTSDRQNEIAEINALAATARRSRRRQYSPPPPGRSAARSPPPPGRSSKNDQGALPTLSSSRSPGRVSFNTKTEIVPLQKGIDEQNQVDPAMAFFSMAASQVTA